MTGKEKVRFGFGARRLMVVFLGGGQTKPPGPSVRSLPCFSTPRVCAPVDRGPGRDGAPSRRRRGRRGPVRDAPFRERPHRDARSSRRAMLRREVRRITRLPIGRTVASRSGGDRGASAAGNEEEDAVRTWTWKTAPCGRTCGFGRNGGTTRGQLRVAFDAPRGGARPMRGCRHRPMKRFIGGDVKREAIRVPDRRPREPSRRATFRGRTWRSRTPCRPRGRRTWSWRTCLLRGCEGSGEVRALECIKHARARLFIDKKSRAKISISVNGTWSY